MPSSRPQPRLDFGAAGNWNAIEARARDFAQRWAGETYERGESQAFWTEFLAIFGIDRRRVGAFFEYRTRKLGGAPGYVDLFYPGRLIAEQKSAGRDLNKAIEQALGYLPAMPDHELPRGLVVSDFATFELIRLDVASGFIPGGGGLTPGENGPTGGERSVSFTLEQLPERVRHFSFLFDLDETTLSEQNPVNVKAAQDISALHEELRKQGYRGKDLEIFLTRIVFCLFAEDTGIFDSGQFSQYVRNESNADGRNLGRVLTELFDILDTAPELRQTNTPATLVAFPYINGGLFADPIRTPQLDADARHAILTATQQNWAEVNPSIFGSMFQGVMDEVERRNLGAHYTSEKNILRLIQPLFLDDLYAELEAARGNRGKLEKLHDRLSRLKFLDPACGSGNFLVITYRELRRLEHKILQELHPHGLGQLDPVFVIRVTPDQMAGIELEEFPSKVAQLALWLTDHQMNIEAAKLFSGSIDLYKRIPIKSQPNIVCANALTTDWGDVVELSALNYIIGNPPFTGAHLMSTSMRDALKAAFPEGHKGVGTLDFVTAWFAKAGQVMSKQTHIRTALVATNSVSQGEQVSVLWSYLYELGMKIDFAHRTFKWRNEAPGVAAVFCVIVGFSNVSHKTAVRLFDYPDIKEEPVEESGVRLIGPYLTQGSSVYVISRNRSICDSPLMSKGSIPVDGGNLLFTHEQYDEVLLAEPDTAVILRPFIGAVEFINGTHRWCFWAEGVDQQIVNQSRILKERFRKVRESRLASKKAATRTYADRPNEFMERRQPTTPYLVVPQVSSENRAYVPIGYVSPEVVASNLVLTVPNATRYHFGVLTSQMHMAWMRTVAGRLKGDYRYSKDIVYNNFPWPEDVSDAQRAKIEELAQAVLDARTAHPTSTLADLYDPLTMPANLRKAHTELDRAVDKLYRSKRFESDDERVAMLLARYQKLVGE